MDTPITNKRILIVDDQSVIRDLLKTVLESYGHTVESAEDGYEALAKIKLDIDLVLLDVEMPKMDGFEVARRLRADPDGRDIPICMVTGNTSQEDRLRAVKAGANDFVAKPVDETELHVRTNSLLERKEAQDAVKRQKEDLERQVEKRTADLRKALDNMASAQRLTNEAHLDTITRLVLAAEYKDVDTAQHIQRVSHIGELLGLRLILPPHEIELLRIAIPMHDVGKLGIPDHILLKPGKLDDAEFGVMKQHTEIGGRILNGSPSELLQAGETIALAHHEKWDGTGYPNGLKGNDIPLWGRICAVADVFDALTSERPYKKAFDVDRAVGIIKEGRGTHFDPELVDIFSDNFNQVVEITKRFSSSNPSSEEFQSNDLQS